ncbi:uncharacterized protein LOC119885739 [Micropterus salmoides]|uniref:uncharacterized protein LOC119885739 n=1 Tax=Micropterus salmoides TaxID=27706 RepID=UPI0018EBC287|nr:uncharacterized protein LOC119885739 [Micropterus salmoides]
MMKRCLLLILLLMAGCESSSGKDSGEDSGKDSGEDSGKDSGEDSGKDSGEDSGKDSGEDSGKDSEEDSNESGASKLKGCQEGWVEFSCNCPNNESISVVTPKNTTLQTTKKDEWENKDRVSLYHDTKKNNLRVVIKQLEPEDFGNYTCKFTQNSSSDHKVKLENETDGCQGQFNQTAYRTAKTTITCNYTGKKYKFFCKENGSICEDISSTKSSLKSNGTFTLTETNSSFSVSISNVSSHDAGVYWCGVETHEGSYRAALRKIQLEVEELGQNNGGSSYNNSTPITIAVVVCVAVLMLGIILVLIYKRFKRSKRNEEAQNNNEDRAYEEIQERPQMPGSGSALKSVYVTANCPTNPSSASQPDYNINIQNRSTEVSGDIFSIVRVDDQCPASSTVSHPARIPNDPYYFTVSMPQQH